MRIAVGGDHAGAELKRYLLSRLADDGYDLIDVGGDGSDPDDDYPDIARRVAEAIRAGDADRGMSVEHDDLNVLCLGGRVIGPEPALECAQAFLDARFSGEERHARRLAKVLALDGEDRHPGWTDRPGWTAAAAASADAHEGPAR